jgi:membrane protein YdbS with pleckstrin-like domain
MSDEKPIYATQRSWWNFTGYIVGFVILTIAIIAAYVYYRSDWNPWLFLLFVVPVALLVIALWKRASMRLRVYDDRVVLKRGILNTSSQVVFCRDVRTVWTERSLPQRMMGIGDVKVATAGTDDYEFKVKGVPEPDRLQTTILEQKIAIVGDEEEGE